MMLPPLVIANLDKSPSELEAAIKSTVQVIRRTDYLQFAYLYAGLLSSVLKGVDMRIAAKEMASCIGFDVAEAVRRQGNSDPMTACYIDSAFPVLLFFAYKYGADPERLLLASANAGGENVARGSLLGALAGAQYGLSGLPTHFKNGLLHSSDLLKEATEFAEIFVHQ
jgi:ADP-ribosylglycohydrolase